MRHLSLNRTGHVATCVISNPPTHTLTAAGVQELDQMLSELEADASLRVLVLRGGGEGIFIRHYEVGELADAAERQSSGAAEVPAEPAGTPRLHAMHRMLLRLERLPAITIAALNGSAGGGGCEVALCCDFRLMADGPYHFGLPETWVGIIPGAGGTQRMTRLLGTARALDLILHGTLPPPQQALALGLVHRVLSAERFGDDVQSFAQNLASRSPLALRAAKQAIREGASLPLVQGLELEQACFDRVMRSKDAAGAMRAMLEGKRYDWKGE
ncbi:MAG: enoyl-CoA hydratase/isomerase family protein [Polyangiales bacterium]